MDEFNSKTYWINFKLQIETIETVMYVYSKFVNY